MKQARKMYGLVVPVGVHRDRGLVEVGLIWMTFFALAISEIGIEALEQTSPMMNFTLSWSMTLLAAFTAGSGVHWLSSTMGSIFTPRTPPLAFHSSMASRAPSRVETPKVGTGPDRGARIATFSVGRAARERHGQRQPRARAPLHRRFMGTSFGNLRGTIVPCRLRERMESSACMNIHPLYSMSRRAVKPDGSAPRAGRSTRSRATTGRSRRRRAGRTGDRNAGPCPR